MFYIDISFRSSKAIGNSTSILHLGYFLHDLSFDDVVSQAEKLIEELQEYGAARRSVMQWNEVREVVSRDIRIAVPYADGHLFLYIKSTSGLSPDDTYLESYPVGSYMLVR